MSRLARSVEERHEGEIQLFSFQFIVEHVEHALEVKNLHV